MTPQELVDKLASNPSESSQQQAVFAWSALPEIRNKYPELKWMFAIPNGGLRFNPGKFKAEGVKSGVWDIFLPFPYFHWSGMWIEMKHQKYKNSRNEGLTIEQIQFKKDLQESYMFYVCYSYNDGIAAIMDYLHAT